MKEFLSILLLTFLIVAGTINNRPVFPVAILLGAILGGLAARHVVERTRNRQVATLQKNLNLLNSGSPIHVGDILVTKETNLTSYRLRIGAIFTSIEFRSPYRLTSDPSQSEAMIYSLLTLLTGWFSLPFGPLSVIEIVVKNFKGGDVVAVAELIEPGKYGELRSKRNSPEHELPEDELDLKSPSSKPSLREGQLESTSHSGEIQSRWSSWFRHKARLRLAKHSDETTSFGSQSLDRHLSQRTVMPTIDTLASHKIGKRTIINESETAERSAPSVKKHSKGE